MRNAPKPSGGQPETSKAETSATRSGALRMSVHIPDDWNPHTALLEIADYARNAGKRADNFSERAADLEEAGKHREAEGLRQAAREAVTREQMREINMMTCLLAMRLSACRITIQREEAGE
jgi:hypothetical protein